MMIDCHSHFWPNPSLLGDAQGFSCLGVKPDRSPRADEHLLACEPAEAVLVLGFVSNYLNAESSNRQLLEHTESFGGRMLAVGGVDPLAKDAAAELRCMKKEGFAGLALSPACQNFHPADTRAMRVYEVAAELGLPVFFLQGEILPQRAVMEFAQPVFFDEVAREFPELRMVITHLGYPWVEQTLALLAKHPHVYADIAGVVNRPLQAYRHLSLAYQYGVMDKLLLGSDYPTYTVKSTVEAIYSLNKITAETVLPVVPRESLRGIVERDALALLGLKNGTV